MLPPIKRLLDRPLDKIAERLWELPIDVMTYRGDHPLDSLRGHAAALRDKAGWADVEEILLAIEILTEHTGSVRKRQHLNRAWLGQASTQAFSQPRPHCYGFSALYTMLRCAGYWPMEALARLHDARWIAAASTAQAEYSIQRDALKHVRPGNWFGWSAGMRGLDAHAAKPSGPAARTDFQVADNDPEDDWKASLRPRLAGLNPPKVEQSGALNLALSVGGFLWGWRHLLRTAGAPATLRDLRQPPGPRPPARAVTDAAADAKGELAEADLRKNYLEFRAGLQAAVANQLEMAGGESVVRLDLACLEGQHHAIVLDTWKVQPCLFDPNFGLFMLPEAGWRSDYFAWLLGVLIIHYEIRNITYASMALPAGRSAAPVRLHDIKQKRR